MPIQAGVRDLYPESNWVESIRRRIDSIAHLAASAITSSASVAARSSAGIADSCPVFPSTIAAFRNNPLRFVRKNDVPRNQRRNCSSVMFNNRMQSSVARVGSFGKLPCPAKRFHGQTSWQTSQPKSQSPIGSRSSTGTDVRNSIVR